VFSAGSISAVLPSPEGAREIALLTSTLVAREKDGARENLDACKVCLAALLILLNLPLLSVFGEKS